MSGRRGEFSKEMSSGSRRSRHSPAPASGAASSESAPPPPPPEHFDDANLYRGAEDAAENFKVVVRARPPLPRELNGFHPFVDVVQVSPQYPRSITLCDALETEDGRGAVYSRQAFTFDHVYDAGAHQQEVYEISAKPAVLSVLEGYNATLMAYGQTGTGKTYTMEGFTSEQERGIIPRSIEEIFAFIQSCRNRDTKFLVRASYMQIYNEVISDLLSSADSNGGVSGHGPTGSRSLTVRHTPRRGVYVDGLSEWIVRTPRDVYGLIERGTAVRATSVTKMSELSSRSHAIFTVVVEVMEGDEARPTSYRFGKLNIVDLAGSEKVRQSGVSGQRLEETKSINKSLHELGNVIAALAAKAQNKHRHIPFRNSVLTSALRDSLGGNCRTTLIACISPALESYTESLSTLMFANRAKSIRNTAIVNEDLDQATLLRKYERELARLRQQLKEQEALGGGPRVSSAALTALQEDRKRAEEDREAALEALYRSSQAHQEEQQLREMLEERIAELETVVTNGGMTGAPRTSDEYNDQLHAELDRERSVMEEDTEQMQRYKALLLKQRDIMLSLTTRLNERDETILALQEELDAYDAHVQTLEDRLGDAADYSTNTPPPLPPPLQSMSRRDAEEYVARARVAGESGNESGDDGRVYASDLEPGRALTADEKLVEVMMLSGGNGGVGGAQARTADSRDASPPSSSAALSSSAERQQQRQQLHRIAEERARQWEAQVKATYDAKVYTLRVQLTAAQDQLRLLNMGHTLLEAETPAAEARRLLNEELHQIMTEHDARASQAQRSLAEEQNKVRRLAQDVEKVRFEVAKLKETLGTTASQSSDMNNQWQALQELVEGVWGRLAPAADTTEPTQTETGTLSTDAAQAARAEVRDEIAAREKAWQAKSKEYERRLEQLEKEAQRPASAKPEPPSGGADAAAMAQLRERLTKVQRALDVQVKDRGAIQTILQHRVKTKVDDICTALPSLIPEKKDVETRAKVIKEAASLQKIVNAAIAAMQEAPEL